MSLLGSLLHKEVVERSDCVGCGLVGSDVAVGSDVVSGKVTAASLPASLCCRSGTLFTSKRGFFLNKVRLIFHRVRELRGRCLSA